MKILLIDDHALFRAGLRLLLGTLGQEVCCLEAATMGEAFQLMAANNDLRLCLLDLALEREHGLDSIKRIKQASPELSIVVVSAEEESGVIRDCIEAGAMSFIPKSVTPDILTLALRSVLSGAVYLPEHIAGALKTAERRPQLTPRQWQVLQCLSRGLPSKVISRELQLSEHTVKEYIALIFQALGVRNRTEAVIKASRLKLNERAGPVGG